VDQRGGIIYTGIITYMETVVLKRMLMKVFPAKNAYINYLPPTTAVGHTCIYTGSVPSITGISGND